MSKMSAAQAAQQNNRDAAGRYAEAAHPEVDDLDLADPAENPAADRDWGKTPVVHEGSQGPFGWGKVNHVVSPAPGITIVECEGHGGIKLSKERNAFIAAPLRNKNGWYEEDDEGTIVGMYHPDAMAKAWYLDPATCSRECREEVARWFTEGYEAATGEIVPPEKSESKQKEAELTDKEKFLAEHTGDFVTTSTSHLPVSLHDWGVIEAVKQETGETRHFMVRHSFFADGRTNTPRVVDPKNHIDVTDVVEDHRREEDALKPKKTPHHDLNISYDGMTPATRARVQKELGTLYRREDGTVATLADLLAEQGPVGKKETYFNGDEKSTYYLEMADGTIRSLSGWAWEAIGIPETNTERENAALAYHHAVRTQKRVERNRKRALNQPATESLSVQMRRKASWDYNVAVVEQVTRDARAEMKRLDDEDTKARDERSRRLESDLLGRVEEGY